MSNLKIVAKEDVDLISTAIFVERFCYLEYQRFICRANGVEFDMEARIAYIEKGVRARIVANTNDNGELSLAGKDLAWLLDAIEGLFVQYKLGQLARVWVLGTEMEHLWRFVRGNFKRLRKIKKDLKSHQDAIDAAAGSAAEKRVQPSFIIARDDIPIVLTCFRLNGFQRLVCEGPDIGLFTVNSDNEAELRYLIDDNLDDEGNLHLSRKADIMAVFDATKNAKKVLGSEVSKVELQEINRIADQLSRAIDPFLAHHEKMLEELERNCHD